jgi:LIM domain
MRNTPPPSAGTDKSNDFLRPGRGPPPRIDPSAASKTPDRLVLGRRIRADSVTDRPFQNPSDLLTPMSDASNYSRSPSLSGSRSPRFDSPRRSATSPLPQDFSPPRSGFDGAFPPFPGLQRTRTDEGRESPDVMYAPKSPNTNGGGSVLKRMNTIAPGPFEAKGRKARTETPPAAAPIPTHQRAPSLSKDYTRPPTANGRGTPDSFGSRKSSNEFRRGQKNSVSSIDYEAEVITAQPQRIGGYGGMGKPSLETGRPSLETSQSAPTNSSNGTMGGYGGLGRPDLQTSQSVVTMTPHRLEAPYGRPNPANRSENAPSARARGMSFGSNTGGDNKRPDLDSNLMKDTPPIPALNAATYSNAGASTRYHTPTQSSSSAGSGYGSDARTGSSRSSPPTSEILAPISEKPAKLVSTINNVISGLQSVKAFGGARGANAFPTKPVQIETTRKNAPLPAMPEGNMESPLDPRMQNFDSRSKAPVESRPKTPAGTDVDLTIGRTTTKSPPRRVPTNKGPCRGCGDTIRGKSVSSADGRLTGKYHKACFVCQTCKEGFETGEFYVMNNLPYCERHYHRLNNSLCSSCDQGIEGQYLETERKQKYHKYCFTCTDCMKVLRDDYFELKGKYYCERDAMRMSRSQPRLLPPGARNPERRRTKLMMI